MGIPIVYSPSRVQRSPLFLSGSPHYNIRAQWVSLSLSCRQETIDVLHVFLGLPLVLLPSGNHRCPPCLLRSSPRCLAVGNPVISSVSFLSSPRCFDVEGPPIFSKPPRSLAVGKHRCPPCLLGSSPRSFASGGPLICFTSSWVSITLSCLQGSNVSSPLTWMGCQRLSADVSDQSPSATYDLRRDGLPLYSLLEFIVRHFVCSRLC